jgi:hypothetical protein
MNSSFCAVRLDACNRPDHGADGDRAANRDGQAVEVGSNKRWRVVNNDGATLSTV